MSMSDTASMLTGWSSLYNRALKQKKCLKLWEKCIKTQFYTSALWLLDLDRQYLGLVGDFSITPGTRDEDSTTCG